MFTLRAFVLSLQTSCLRCTFTFTFTMFFKPNTVKSSNIRSIMLNPSTNQVIVQYINNAKTYLYDNVNGEAITDFFFGEFESVGKFVNAYCKPNMTTVIG